MTGFARALGWYGIEGFALLRRAMLVSFFAAAGCHTVGQVFLNPRDLTEAPVVRDAAARGAEATPADPAVEQASFQDKLPPARPADEGKVYQPSAAAPPLTDITPVMPPPAKESPINLPTALELAGVENPQIALAQEIVRENLALQMRARVLLVPSTTVGGNYHLHDGLLQTSFGLMRQVDSQSLFTGLGARTLAAETVAFPGIRLFAQLTDAIFAPLAARQDVVNSEYEAAATRNNVLLDVATAYLALLGAEGRLAVIRQSETDFREVVRLTDAYARAGQGREGDANRARTDALRLHIQEQGAEEQVAVASADLSRLLHLDPSKRLFIVDGPIQVVQLVDTHLNLDQLIDIALHNRPEIGAQNAAIAAAQIRYRQERVRPLLPMLSVGYSNGWFGGGSNESHPSFGRNAGRGDFDVFAVWTLQNAGLGNLAIQKQRRAQIGEAQAMLGEALNQVRREVAEAYSRSAARRREVTVAQRQVESAVTGLGRDLVRIRGGQGLPIEVLNSANLLVRSRQELLGAIIGFDQAQFQLFVALGQPPPDPAKAAIPAGGVGP